MDSSSTVGSNTFACFCKLGDSLSPLPLYDLFFKSGKTDECRNSQMQVKSPNFPSFKISGADSAGLSYYRP